MSSFALYAQITHSGTKTCFILFEGFSPSIIFVDNINDNRNVTDKTEPQKCRMALVLFRKKAPSGQQRFPWENTCPKEEENACSTFLNPGSLVLGFKF
jgi:hypothetical protein